MRSIYLEGVVSPQKSVEFTKALLKLGLRAYLQLTWENKPNSFEPSARKFKPRQKKTKKTTKVRFLSQLSSVLHHCLNLWIWFVFSGKLKISLVNKFLAKLLWIQLFLGQNNNFQVKKAQPFWINLPHVRQALSTF